MKTRLMCLAITILILAAALTGCSAPQATPAAVETTAPVESAEPVTLTIAGGWEDCRAIEAVSRKFAEKYPNCTVVYEYLQDFYSSAEKRMTGNNAIDMFFTTNLQEGAQLLPYALDLLSRKDIDFSGVFDGLMENFIFRESTQGEKKLYAMPLGAELRGLYVNVTLLDSLGIKMPTDQASLLAACETLKQNGYIPFHGNPSSFAQTLLYPWICNLIANADDPTAAYNKVDKREAGLSEMFAEPYSFLYTLVENGYYDYKLAQTDLGLFVDTTDKAYICDFLSIKDTDGILEKLDDVGKVAFMPSPMSIRSLMDRIKDDCHSEIKYEFVLAPVSDKGGFAYMSPAHGIAINKGSANVDWCAKFFDFLFQPEINELFADGFSIIPNTKTALDYITKLYAIPNNQISQLGQVTFSYGFYDVITKNMVELSKANNPKYMQQNADGTTSLYPLSYYTDKLEESIKGNEQ